MSNPEYIPFKYGATAHFPAKKQGKSDIVMIDISPHPIIYSRALCTARLDKKLAENDVYLSICRRVCEERCPVRTHSQINVICKRLTSLRAIAKTEDSSELDVDKWSEVLSLSLCRPVLYWQHSWRRYCLNHQFYFWWDQTPPGSHAHANSGTGSKAKYVSRETISTPSDRILLANS